ncbi:MAG: hypothetical protein ACI4I3_02255 [Acutalibacteraceae bacterium]
MSKKIIAILLALSFVFAFAACGGKTEDTTTTTAETTEDPFAEVDATTAAPVAEDSTAAPAAEDTTAAGAEDTTAASQAADDSTAAASEETTAAAAMPQTKEEIVNYFNTAINAVKPNAKSITRKYSKITLNGTPVFPSSINNILKLLGGAESFLSEQLAKNSKGEETYKGDDIKAVFPVEGESYSSKLTAADVKEAKIVEKDGKYIIRITTVADGKSDSIKHGQGHAPKAFNVVLPGVVNDNIPGVATGIVGTATMNYPSSTVTVTIDPATGRVLNADYDLKWTINFDKVGVVIPFTTNDYFIINY